MLRRIIPLLYIRVNRRTYFLHGTKIVFVILNENIEIYIEKNGECFKLRGFLKNSDIIEALSQ